MANKGVSLVIQFLQRNAMMKHIRILKRQIPGNADGFTLFEIIITVLIMAIAIVPMLNAYAPGVFSTIGVEGTAVFTNQARATLNRVAALDFQTLDNNRGDPVNLTSLFDSAAEAAKETFTYRGKNYTPNVVITDASEGVGGLLEISVTVDTASLKVLKASY